MYMKAAKIVQFAVMGEKYGYACGKSKVSYIFIYLCPRELQPMPLADGDLERAGDTMIVETGPCNVRVFSSHLGFSGSSRDQSFGN